MKSNNLIDLKKTRSAKEEVGSAEADYLANLEALRAEKKKRMRHEARKAAVIAEGNGAAKTEKIDRGVFSLPPSEINTFWLKLGRSFLYLLIFLLPLFFLPTTIYPVDANKQLLATVLVSASFICYLANAYFTRRIIYSKSILIFAAVFFVIAAGISAFFSVSPNNSLYGDFTQADVLNDFIVSALALYLVSVLFRKEDFNRIGAAFLASTVLISVLGLLQLFGVYVFPSVFGGSFDFTKQVGFNVFGSVINFDIFISFGLVLIVAALTELDNSLKTKAGLVFAGLLIALNLVLINYQPIWILLSAMMTIYAVYKFTFRKEEDAVSSVGSSIPLIIGIAAFLFALVGPSLPAVMNMPKIPIDVKPNLSATLNISKGALSGLRILTGTGLATFSSQYSIYRPVELNQSGFWRLRFNQGFSFVSTYLTTAGVIGVLSVLFMVYAFMRLALRNTEDKKTMVISVGALFMILGWFFYSAYFVGFIFSFMILGVLAAFDSQPEELVFSRVPKNRAMAGFLVLVVSLAGTISMLYFYGKKYVAAVYFQNGLKEFSSTDMIRTLENVARAVSLDRTNDQYLRSASLLMLTDAGNSLDPNIEVSKNEKYLKKVDDSTNLARTAAAVNPAESENWYNLGDVYEKLIKIADGADLAAEKNYLKAIELNPKNPDPLIGQARVLMSAARLAQDSKVKDEKVEKAIEILKKAIDLKPDYAASRFQLGSAYVLGNRNGEAIKEFEYAKTLFDPDTLINFQLGTLYYNNGDFDRAKTEMENAVKSDPAFSNARYVLGLIYDKKGEKDNAIIQFENVLKMNPNNDEVKKILDNLKTKGSAFVAGKPSLAEEPGSSLNLPKPNR